MYLFFKKLTFIYFHHEEKIDGVAKFGCVTLLMEREVRVPLNYVKYI